jgi:hypothetical protein
VVHLDEIFRVPETIILVDQSRLELTRPGDLPEFWCQGAETALPNGVAPHSGERRGGDDDLA